jgi:septum site-determining protein MinC
VTGFAVSRRYRQLLSSRQFSLREADERMTVATSSNAQTARDPDAFKLRGGSFTLLVLQLIDLKDPNFFQWLLDKIGQAPNFYRHAPVVLDLGGLAEAGPFNFAELARRLRQHQLVPVGVQNGTEEQNQGAINAGLSVFPMWRAAKPVEAPPAPEQTAAEPAPRKQPEAAAPPPAEPARHAKDGSKVVLQPIRSGRQVYAQQGDLVVLSTVSAGAELLADGHIHVYGTLRGRALAGVSGDTTARIFCRSLQAELVSIAGHWLVREDMDDHLIGRTVQIYLNGDLLVIEPMN